MSGALPMRISMICIIDYGMGNLRSVEKALYMLGADVTISSKQEDLESADKLILPGVGAFGHAMENLRKRKLIEVMDKEVLKNKKPFLGICLGMQLVASKSYELGEFKGLDWVKGEVKKLPVEKMGLKIPHVGWNDLLIKKESGLLTGIKPKSSFYFVHSFALYPEDTKTIIGSCSYGVEFAAAIEKDNIFATQFHPEKSQKDGLRILENFMKF